MEKPEYDNLLDYFQFYLFPLALTIGMTPEQFWEDDPELFFSYMDAYEYKKEREAKEEDVKAYNLARYILLAIRDSLQMSKSPKKIFPKKPFSMQKNNSKPQFTPEEYQELRKIQMQEFVKNFNKK